MKVLITGGSRGLGLALTKEFLADHHQVVTCSRSGSMDLDGQPEVNLKNYTGDITDDSYLQHLIRSEPDCDILINNAGVGFDGILATQSCKNIHQLLQTNLYAAVVLTKLFVRAHFGRGSAGSVVNISSITAVRGFSGLAVYSATKAGLIGFTRSLARELGSKGFRVNAVMPGYFESEMSSGLRPDQLRQIIRRTPLGRIGTVNDIVPVVKFLVSPAAQFITGQVIVVDGGVSC